MLVDRARSIKLLILDVDGVLTDGRMIVGSDGSEYKCFDVKDGTGVTLALRAGIRIAIITGKSSKIVEQRAAALGIELLFQEVHDKLQVYRTLLREEGLSDHQVAFIGDDLIDLPVLRRVGLAIAVADAVAPVKAVAHWVTTRVGGRGAVREVIELLLTSQGKWQDILAEYEGQGVSEGEVQSDTP